MTLPLTGPGFMGQLAMLGLQDPEAFALAAAEAGVPPPTPGAGGTLGLGGVGKLMQPQTAAAAPPAAPAPSGGMGGLDAAARESAAREGLNLTPPMPPAIEVGQLPQPAMAQTPTTAPPALPGPAPIGAASTPPAAQEGPGAADALKALSALQSNRPQLPAPPAAVTPPQGRGTGQGDALMALLQRSGLAPAGGGIPSLGALIGGR